MAKQNSNVNAVVGELLQCMGKTRPLVVLWKRQLLVNNKKNV